MQQWQTDVLGPDFEALTLPLGEDEEGELVATLVRHVSPRPKRNWWQRLTQPNLPSQPLEDVDVLYVHGWSDYFFQRELAEFWSNRGARFFALDLRKYGRSLRPGQSPGNVADLADYDADIDAALRAMQSAGRRVFLLGHSTGGLVLTLWLDRNPGRADALILNSPWLETQGSTIARLLLTPIFKAQARVANTTRLPSPDLGYYYRSIAKAVGGEWDIDANWRPERGFSATPAWAAAIVAGHAKVAAGLSIDVPVLTLLSKRSLISPVWSDEMRSSDIVLLVDDIAKRALGLGETVTVVRLDGALHDVFLSAAPVRGEAYRQIDRWLAGYAKP